MCLFLHLELKDEYVEFFIKNSSGLEPGIS